MRLLSIFCLSLLFVAAAFATANADTKAEREDILRLRIEKTLSGYLGKPSGFLVNVSEKAEQSADKAAEDTQAAPAQDGEWMDLGYMSVPRSDGAGDSDDFGTPVEHKYEVK